MRVSYFFAVCLATSGCVAVPKDETRSYDLIGNYQAIADCAFPKVADIGAWTKADFPTQQKSVFTVTFSEMPIGRIAIIDNGNDTTHVVHWIMPAGRGKDYIDNLYETEIRKCDQSLSRNETQ